MSENELQQLETPNIISHTLTSHHKEKLWKDTEENWQSTYRGLEKTGFNGFLYNGIIISPEDRRYHTPSLILLFYSILIQWILIISGFVSLFKASEDLILFIEIAHFYIILIAIHVLFIQHYLYNITMFRRVFQVLDEGIFDYGTEFDRDLMKNNSIDINFYMSYFKVGFSGLLLAIAVALSAIPLVQFARGVERVHKGILVILPVPFWFPFDTETGTGFALAYLIQINMILLAVLYISTYVPYLLQMMMEIFSQLKVLNHSISNIEERASVMYNSCKQTDDLAEITMNKANDLRDNLYEYCYSTCLRKNIFHHKAILRFFTLFQNVNSTLFGVMLGTNMVVIAAISIVITKIGFSMDSLKFYLIMLIELINVFVYCYLGTLITEEAKLIGVTIYNTPWTLSSKSNKSILKFIQLRVVNEVVLKGNGVFSLNLQLYIQIMQTSYSIFNLFNSFET